MKLKYILIGFLLLMLNGCLLYTSVEKAKKMVGAGQPDEYYMGFADGCDSGLERAGKRLRAFSKDNNAYLSNGFYKSGWDDGLDRCYNDAIKRDKEWRQYRMELAIDKYLYEQKE